ncbi:hypothetical protein K504DRAFT_506205 [Pleomassaria siparia CBS 279.74]|uniref:Uncharacterized protein n=1 Tax=Pleomassaria siparia CBS 279.74 TaxID=1314801 RepID=A0A6G1JYH2_9PLEO|nr:hypothetical protein K504DRAFT_506205 [Pleomassaria siparia CBS 279.74]
MGLFLINGIIDHGIVSKPWCATYLLSPNSKAALTWGRFIRYEYEYLLLPYKRAVVRIASNELHVNDAEVFVEGTKVGSRSVKGPGPGSVPFRRLSGLLNRRDGSRATLNPPAGPRPCVLTSKGLGSGSGSDGQDESRSTPQSVPWFRAMESFYHGHRLRNRAG